MKKLLQIDSCLGILSTGKITESIARLAMSRGWGCHIMHGARCIGETIQHHYQVTSLIGEYAHYAESLLFDRHGLGSRIATKRIVEKIKEMVHYNIEKHKKVCILTVEEHKNEYVEGDIIVLGNISNLSTVAKSLFEALRECDDLGADIILAEGYEEKGVGVAIMNRLNKAAGFDIINV